MSCVSASPMWKSDGLSFGSTSRHVIGTATGALSRARVLQGITAMAPRRLRGQSTRSRPGGDVGHRSGTRVVRPSTRLGLSRLPSWPQKAGWSILFHGLCVRRGIGKLGQVLVRRTFLLKCFIE